MNYQKQYADKINWKNSPDTSTPLNATNLNKMDNALWYMDTALYTISKAIGGGSSARGGIISNVGNNAFTTHVHQRTGESLAENELLILRSDVSGTGNSINVYTSSSSAAGFDLLDLDGESTSITVTTDSVVFLMITDADTDYTAQVLAVIDTAGGVAYSGLGIGKKTGVSSNVIDTDIDLHRAPMAGDRLLVYFDETVQNPTGLKTYNNGVAVTSNLENATPLYINAGWNILEFKNDGLLYNNVWMRKQNVPVPSTLAGMSDTLIVSPSDDQLLVYDNGKWKNQKYIEANVGFSDTELKKIKVGDIVYDTDGLRDYSVSSIANNNITISVLNSNQFVMENIAINTGNHSGSSNGWNLVISDGLNPVSVALKNADGSPFADDIHENELLFVYVDTAGNIARVLGTAGASNEVYSAFNLLSKSEVAESVPYLYRRSGGAVRDVALEHLKKVVGASVAWNQLVQNGDFADTSNWSLTESTGKTFTVTNNIGKVTITDNTASGNLRPNIKQAISQAPVVGHKYILSVDCKITTQSSNNYPFSFLWGNQHQVGTVAKNSWGHLTTIGNVADLSFGSTLYLYINSYLSYFNNGDTVEYKNVQIIDLTQLFGTAIADYIYSLEQATSGSGIAKLKEWGFFTKDYYAYNTGALQSVKTSGKKCVGKNQWSAGDQTFTRMKKVSFGKTFPAGNYVVSSDIQTSASTIRFVLLNGDTEITGGGASVINNHVVWELTPASPFNGCYMYAAADYASGAGIEATYTRTQLETGTTVTAYEPYTEKTYSLSDVELRGLFKLDSNNNLYADGDEYTPDGNVKRKYGIVDLSTLSWTTITLNRWHTGTISGVKPFAITVVANAISNHVVYSAKEIYDNTTLLGIAIDNTSDIIVRNGSITTPPTGYLIYELATATTETTTPFAETMLVDGDGTEEFLDSRDIPVPVGHESEYNQAIKGLPTAPTTDGNYKLRCTVTNGAPSFSWVSDT